MHKFFCEAYPLRFDRGKVPLGGVCLFAVNFMRSASLRAARGLPGNSADIGQRNGLVGQYATRALASWLIKDRRGRIAGGATLIGQKLGAKPNQPCESD